MCYEFSSLFEKARARQLRRDQQRAQAQRQQQQQPTPAAPQTPPAAEPAKPRETIPV
jgi:hypothetical protein